MEDWQNAIKLETFIRYHTPKGYREPIHRFDFVPYINATDFTAIKQAYDNGTLQSFLETYKRQIFDYVIYPFNKPYIIDAITTYFDKFSKPTNETLKFAEDYEKALKEGNARFGSVCDHKKTKNGVCRKCFRKVIG